MMTIREFEKATYEGGHCIDGNRVIEDYNRYFHENAEVGDGVTVCYWTDREAYTIIKRTRDTLTIRRDKATLKPDFKPEWVPGGFAGVVLNNNEQDYDYEPNEDGAVMRVYWSNKKGRFIAQGHLHVIAGRHEFYDYNF